SVRILTAMSREERLELLQGTLDLLILQSLRRGPAHGHTIMEAIEQRSGSVLRVEQGSLYPALHRLIKRGWIAFEHGTSENNRRARYTPPPAGGRKQRAGEPSSGEKRAGATARVLRRACPGSAARRSTISTTTSATTWRAKPTRTSPAACRRRRPRRPRGARS